jgi:hypothetical protein
MVLLCKEQEQLYQEATISWRLFQIETKLEHISETL